VRGERKSGPTFAAQQLIGVPQSRTENRFALFLELLFVIPQFRTENRFTLFLELL